MAAKRRPKPAKRDLPEPIPDSPENVAAALMASPPRKSEEWRYTDRDEASASEDCA